MAFNKNRKVAVYSERAESGRLGNPEEDQVVKLRNPEKYVVRMPTHDEVDGQNGRKYTAASEHFRNSMFVLRDVILLNPTESTKRKDDDSSFIGGSSDTLTKATNECCFATGSFFALRILFIDLLVICCDLASGFLQGYALYSTEGKEKYGLITFAINWIPGICAAIHVLSVYRREMAWYKAILFAVLLIIFYPIIPILALLILLWMKPNNKKSTKEFKEAEYNASVVSAIRGCIASPIQLTFQLILAINGIIQLEWSQLVSLTITDWAGNEILISFAAPVCMFFSMIRLVDVRNIFIFRFPNYNF